MRATDDVACREVAFAAAALQLPAAVATAAVGTASDGLSHALLMRDIEADLIAPGDRMITDARYERIIDGMAALHSSSVPPADAAPGAACASG